MTVDSGKVSKNDKIIKKILKISYHFCQLVETHNSTSISAWASHPDSDLDQVVHKKKNRLCKTGCYWLSLYIDGAWREIPVDRTLPKGPDLLKIKILLENHRKNVH